MEGLAATALNLPKAAPQGPASRTRTCPSNTASPEKPRSDNQNDHMSTDAKRPSYIPSHIRTRASNADKHPGEVCLPKKQATKEEMKKKRDAEAAAVKEKEEREQFLKQRIQEIMLRQKDKYGHHKDAAVVARKTTESSIAHAITTLETQENLPVSYGPSTEDNDILSSFPAIERKGKSVQGDTYKSRSFAALDSPRESEMKSGMSSTSVDVGGRNSESFALRWMPSYNGSDAEKDMRTTFARHGPIAGIVAKAKWPAGADDRLIESEDDTITSDCEELQLVADPDEDAEGETDEEHQTNNPKANYELFDLSIIRSEDEEEENALDSEFTMTAVAKAPGRTGTTPSQVLKRRRKEVEPSPVERIVASSQRRRNTSALAGRRQRVALESVGDSIEDTGSGKQTVPQVRPKASQKRSVARDYGDLQTNTVNCANTSYLRAGRGRTRAQSSKGQKQTRTRITRPPPASPSTRTVTADFPTGGNNSYGTTSGENNGATNTASNTRTFDVSRKTSQSDITLTIDVQRPRSSSVSSTLSAGTKVYREVNGVAYNKLGQRLPKGRGSRYSNDDFDNSVDKVTFRSNIIPTFMAYFSMRPDPWSTESLEEPMKHIWEVYLPHLDWKVWSKVCNHLLKQRLYEWRSKFYTVAGSAVATYLSELASSAVIRSGRTSAFVCKLLEESDEMGPNMIWKTYPSEVMTVFRKDMTKQQHSGCLCTDVILHTYAHHARYIKTANMELAVEVYELFKEDPSTLNKDDAEIEKAFRHDQRGALALVAAAVERDYEQYIGSKNGERIENPLKDKFVMDRETIERIDYFMDYVNGTLDWQWRRIIAEVDTIIYATEDLHPSTAKSTRSPEDESELRAAKSKRRKIAALDFDEEYNSDVEDTN